MRVSQRDSRENNHSASAKSKARGRGANGAAIAVGDLVYLVSERSKTQARAKYLVTAISDGKCTVRKFSRLHFRRKPYSVPLTGVYPITGQDSSVQTFPESSSDSDDDEVMPLQYDMPSAPVEGQVRDDVGGNEMHSDDDNNDVADAVRDDNGRARRRRNEPDRFGDVVVGVQYNESMGNI